MPSEVVAIADGRSLCLERFGDPQGSPVLYFPGLPGSRLDLVAEEAVFAQAGVAVLAVDRPGFGGSSHVPGRTLLDWPRDVEGLAQRLGLERFAVAGYSSGGKYALACAIALPQRVSLAAVMSGVGPPETPGFRASLGRVDRLSLTLAVRARPLALALWGTARRVALGRYSERVVVGFEQEASASDRAVLADPVARAALLRSVQEGLRPGAAGVVCDYALEAREWGFAVEAIRVPVRLWHGDDDGVVPLAHSRYLERRIPGAQLTLLDGAGHLLRGRLEPIARVLGAHR